MSAITIHDKALAVTPDQRDALIYECDDWGAPTGAPGVAALADDLAVPNGEGKYEISNVPRDELIGILEHSLLLAQEFGTHGKFLRTWHTCIVLLGELGHGIEGDIYDMITCHCAQCVQRRAEVA